MTVGNRRTYGIKVLVFTNRRKEKRTLRSKSDRRSLRSESKKLQVLFYKKKILDVEETFRTEKNVRRKLTPDDIIMVTRITVPLHSPRTSKTVCTRTKLFFRTIEDL